MNSQMTFDDYIQRGMELRSKNDTLAWDLGDLAIEVSVIVDKKGFNTFAKAIGVKVVTLKRYRDIAKAYPDNQVREEFAILSWSHFRQVAANTDRMALLTRAADENWSCEKLVIMSKGGAIDDGYVVPPKPELKLCFKCRKWYLADQTDFCGNRGKCE